MKKYCWIIIVACCSLSLGNHSAKAQAVQWTSFEHLSDSLRKERKPLLVFIHTDWCKYCKVMETKTFKEPLLADALNKDFYCLSLNAEETKSLVFLNRKYKFKPTGVNTGIHELAEVLGTEQGKLTFPTMVLFDQNLQLQGRIVGVMAAKQLQQLCEQMD
ncbi:MAG: thioredoxin family protein [Runella zeae]